MFINDQYWYEMCTDSFYSAWSDARAKQKEITNAFDVFHDLYSAYCAR